MSACSEAAPFNLAQALGAQPTAAEAPPTPASETPTRDVEAPEVFSVKETGLWDGRPSLGGVWIAHPDVTEPERVIIRNLQNDQFAVGALFAKAKGIPGPRLQMSSDAASSLGVTAGVPVELTVVALRSETDTPLDHAAIANKAPTPTQTVATTAATRPVAIALDRPFVQIGIFSQRPNADRAAQQMRNTGLIPTIDPQQLGGKPFWRVVVGPARTADEHAALLDKIRREGFSDAYAVAN
ncbi:SPOR domain-containing protein [uncultured Roseobacter sp.]|uniref:SPOR domain-containing protein n=1 Tax=uncultured Roseobacter sp. TaxID=114847 RepID=UPI00263502C7|nr:SPOR domain-containing protein [uncultured Roseobacter sp.]